MRTTLVHPVDPRNYRFFVHNPARGPDADVHMLSTLNFRWSSRITTVIHSIHRSY